MLNVNSCSLNTKDKNKSSTLFQNETMRGGYMVKLLIMADDFTGALDTGVQFAGRGAETVVVTNLNFDFKTLDPKVEVLVMVTETRHLSATEAYDIVYGVVKRALDAGISTIYKKTDSALRGNIGSELKALMDAAKIRNLPFIPAFPVLKRVTCKGIHYIEGIPVAESVFGKDPFEPILDSSVEKIIRSQVEVSVVIHERDSSYDAKEIGIQVFDAETEEDLQEIGKGLGLQGLRFSAGCAGFASTLADLLGINGPTHQGEKLEENLFIACGSVNPVTIRQMKAAREAGFPHIQLTPEQKLEASWLKKEASDEEIKRWIQMASGEKRFILDVNDPEGADDTLKYKEAHGLTTEDLRVSISDNLAAIMKRMLDGGLKATVLCTGGDTLMALMQVLEIDELIPIYELAPGVVATKFNYKGRDYNMISKSGGIGDEDLLLRIADMIC